MTPTFRRALTGIASAAAIIAPAAAQLQRSFPQNALRGSLTVVVPPEVELNGRSARLAPGARIRDADNMLQLSGALVGQRYIVNYTVDIGGLVKDVWILRAEEAAVRPWPTTPEQAQTWSFDPVAQSWSRP